MADGERQWGVAEQGRLGDVCYDTLHTAPAKLGEVARAAGVKRLLLSHIPGLVEARRPEVPRSIRRSYKGPIGFASTGLRLPLPR